MVKKLLHTRYRVHDLEETVSFYKDVLGLEELRRQTSGRGSQLVFLRAPGSEEEIEICKFDESGPVTVGPDLTHLAFEVDDLDKFVKLRQSPPGTEKMQMLGLLLLAKQKRRNQLMLHHTGNAQRRKTPKNQFPRRPSIPRMEFRRPAQPR